ncbi:L-aminoadipate-semialdehyde dehydrogenase-phosphopantetheinyl transferase-like isoform X2 [Impatiens glandulifera]|uniref:L-aminoadipate-semialdehyde dehydrogenase-phosphopantetheinyl transferase-like isoform X2 n=1 Tax=Impatiens glandulifera TaxID=253017 RepID=UPI001FB08F25|nr:L-aminoadipate-semialdehyde dehydrogenase-phosphopantetheinyl transferase-like isoform X2 [Impatiens glandulifera]
MVLQEGVKRWLVDISEWEPSPQDFSAALSSLPQLDHHSITRFVKLEDRKRALVSRLLQYSLVHQVLGIPFQDILIKRTFEGKPYLEGSDYSKTLDFPNFNFNVSHHGDYVAIASEPISLIGVDIVAPSTPIGNKETVPEFISSFTSYFSTLEWSNIVNAANHDQMLTNFYRYWCLKESYVKAIGKGVGERLDKVEFHHIGWNNIYVKIDGTILSDWKFWLSQLQKNHLGGDCR